MATLADIWTLVNDPSLTQKVASACLIAAEAIRVENTGAANHANRLKWAKATLSDPTSAATRMLRAVLAANASATLGQITGASDATIQSAVNAAVDVFADGN